MELIVKFESPHLLKAAEIVANAIMRRNAVAATVCLTSSEAPAEDTPVAPVEAPVETPVATPAEAAPVAPVEAPAAPVQAPVAPAAPVAPVAAPSYTLQDLVDAGRVLIQGDPTDATRKKLATLLSQYGATAVTGLTAEQIPTFAQAMKGLGAKL